MGLVPYEKRPQGAPPTLVPREDLERRQMSVSQEADSQQILNLLAPSS